MTTKRNRDAALRDYDAFMDRARAANYRYCKREGEPSLAEIAEMCEKFGKTFEDFKAKNDERLKQIESKGSADVVTRDELVKIQDEMGTLADLKKALEKLQKEAARPPVGGGEVDPADNQVQRDHVATFLRALRNPKDHQRQADLQNAEKAAIDEIVARNAPYIKDVDTTAPTTGGSAVPELISRQINRNLEEISEVRNLVKTVTAGTPDYKELVDVLGTAFGWVGETDVRAGTGTPTLEEVAPSFGTIYAYPKATEEAMNDIFFDVQGWLIDGITEAFSKGTEAAVFNGDGVKKPTGILGGPAPTTDEDGTRAFGTLQYFPSLTAADFLEANRDQLLKLVYGLKKGYRGNARWAMNKATVGHLRTFKDSQGAYIWQPGMQLGQPDTLHGYPIWESEEMPDRNVANAFPIAFGDFEAGYVLVDLVGFRLTTDDNITQPGYVKWYARRRMGGKLLKTEAIKLLKVALT